jgi:hypothetical protein
VMVLKIYIQARVYRTPDSSWESVAWPLVDMIEHLSNESMDFTPLPDSMYLIASRTLPTITDSDSEMRIEFGGIMRTGGGRQLRCSILTFRKNGFLKSYQHDALRISVTSP